MGVFTQVASNIKGFARKFACKSAYASCVNGASGFFSFNKTFGSPFLHRTFCRVHPGVLGVWERPLTPRANHHINAPNQKAFFFCSFVFFFLVVFRFLLSFQASLSPRQIPSKGDRQFRSLGCKRRSRWISVSVRHTKTLREERFFSPCLPQTSQPICLIE